MTRMLVLILASSAATAQAPNGAIRGTVMDSVGAPLSGVEVASAGKEARAVTTERGQFVLAALAQGLHTVVAQRAGFAPETSLVTLNEGDTLDVQIKLLKVTVGGSRLAATDRADKPGTASAASTAFDRRRARGGSGHHITREQIDKRNPRFVSDMLRGVAGVRIVNRNGALVPVSTRGPRQDAQRDGTVRVSDCVMHVGLDGSSTERSFLMDDVSPKDVYGIEVFAGAASIPAEYGGLRGEAWCGLIMIWTRYQ